MAMELLRLKRVEKGLLALSDPRRLRCMSAGGGEGGLLLLLEEELSEDMMEIGSKLGSLAGSYL